ncbi:prepilin peptidase [Gluconacetobacter tumulisoli]|uniref:Prepilin leader peptidase/N-methyltransferase n=1 Tax=Gluconacetobacter tumulisoli TaxID=1286189 RepID=A0A7W4PM41_9PROT|nr:A24 family peptidase [Gluconacetobacter tumulisoli]MBB2202583.1 prepilin peptidase [Gluconacetobacter tumulisoli]
MLDSPWLPLVLAPFIGSFLGVLASRLPRGEPVVFARSACMQCRTVLGPRDMVPVVSYLVRKGRCRSCGGVIHLSHLLMEVLAVLVAAVVLSVVGSAGVPGNGAFPSPFLLWGGCLFGWWLLTLGMIDLAYFRLPDILTLPLVVAGLAMSAPAGVAAILWHGGAAMMGYGSFRVIALLYRRVRGHDGLGGGDAKLLAAGGAWLGPQALPHIVLVAALLTLCGAAIAGRGRLDRGLAVPFGPGLALAMWGIWLWQAWLLRPDGLAL